MSFLSCLFIGAVVRLVVNRLRYNHPAETRHFRDVLGIAGEMVAQLKPVIVKTYRGSQNSAARKFQSDAAKLAEDGYVPTSQSWAPGSYGCLAFLLALVLCLVIIGIVIFIFMLIVPPEGALSVTYTLRPAGYAVAGESKTCPKCAEVVKAGAMVCRFCGHQFSNE